MEGFGSVVMMVGVMAESYGGVMTGSYGDGCDGGKLWWWSREAGRTATAPPSSLHIMCNTA